MGTAAWTFVAVAGVAASVALGLAVHWHRVARGLAAGVAVDREHQSGALAEATDSVERLADAFAVLDFGIVVADAERGPILENRQAQALFTEPTGGALLRATVEELIEQAMTGSPGDETLELFGPPRRTLRIVADPLRRGPSVTGVVVVIEDVSERRHLESVRRDFVANISHELKTPVGALGLLAETLVDEEDPVVVQRLASRMQHEAMRVGRIIEDLLDLSRIESEETPVREPVPVNVVVAEATERLRSAAEQQSVRLEVVDADPHLTVAGDRRQLVSAVHSLVENAITYTDSGGLVRVVVAGSGGTVSIEVSDTGVGIPARDIDRIFERFYRVDRARARATGGTGLGLSIVRHVVTNHGGRIDVRSQEGSGSTFTLTLPSGPARAATGEVR